jgi:transglutaminase-like putative cysteine protease
MVLAAGNRYPVSAAVPLVALLLAATPAAGQPAGPPWTVSPPARWLLPVEVPSADVPLGSAADSGRLYLLVDHQIRAGAATTDYRRYAWTALSTAGVQNASEIQVRFDPTFERLVIHHVRLLRDGRDVFSFRPSDVRVIQQERSLDEQIYSGELTAVVFLRDLRPGDTLDYAYSIEGANPILTGGFDAELPLAYEAPVRLVRHVVQVPAGTRLSIAPRRTALVPLTTTSGGWQTLTWTARDVPASIADEDEPGWFDPDPRIEIGTFATWAEVADWARALFEQQATASPELAALVDRCRAVPGGPRAAAAEAVRFVQDEVRYLGIEMGPSSHRPHPPGQVLRQRFGDCKDKSLLLVALLRALGVEAAPALVDTVRGRGLDDAHPSPFAFDHVVVRAVIDGREVWIDATDSDLGGALEDRDPPAFERALVLRPGTRDLTRIPVPDRREPAVVVSEAFTLGRGGSSARLDVVSTFRRGEADAMRADLASTSPQDLAKQYLEDYARDEAEIKALAPPAVRDDRARNILVVTESYELPTFWKNGKRELRGWEVEHHVPPRVAATRATPLSVPHPVHVRHEIVVRAPARLRLGRFGESLTGRAFSFTSALSTSGRECTLTFDYRTLADSVRPEHLKAHALDVERLDDALSFELLSDLTSPDAPEEGWSGTVAIGSGTALAVAAALAAVAGIRARRKRGARGRGRPDGESGR